MIRLHASSALSLRWPAHLKVRAPLGGVAMGFTAVVDGLAAFRRLNAFVSRSCPVMK